MFSIPGNPPISTSQDLRNGQLQTLGTGSQHGRRAGADRSSSTTPRCPRRGSGRAACRWRCRGRRRSTSPTSATTASTGCGAFQGGANGAVDLNAVDIGAAYLPQNQDPTLGPSAVPGASALHDEPAAARSAGFEQHQRAADAVLGRRTTRIQMSFNRRFRNGLAFGANYTLGLSLKGNTGLQLRLQHAADGTISVRADQARVREAEREPRPAAPHDQGQRGVGPPERAVEAGAAVGTATSSTTGSCRAC